VKDHIHHAIRLRGSLEEQNIILIRVRLRFITLHLTLICEIELISGQGDDDGWIALTLQLFDP
jgi:hypothetical protein